MYWLFAKSHNLIKTRQYPIPQGEDQALNQDDPKKPKLDASSTEPPRNVPTLPTPQARGSMRSPLFKGDLASSQLPPLPPPPPPPPRHQAAKTASPAATTPSKAALTAKEMATFPDNDKKTLATSLTPQLFSEPKPSSHGLIIKLALLGAVATMALWFFAPEWTVPLGSVWRWVQVRFLSEESAVSISNFKPSSRFDQDAAERLVDKDKKGLSALNTGLTDCQQAQLLLAAPKIDAKNRNKQISLRTRAAECLLASGDARTASEVLTPLKRLLTATTEEKLNRQKSHAALAEAQQLLAIALGRLGKHQEAATVVGNHCRQWRPSNTCVAKLLSLSQQSQIEKTLSSDKKAMAKLFKTRGQLVGKAEARLWYAGALLALQDGQDNVTNKRLALALSAAPRDALYLRKEIYAAQAREWYYQAETNKLKDLLDRARQELVSLTKQAKMSFIVLDDFVRSTDHKLTLLRLFRRDDLLKIAAQQPELLSIMGIEALRWQMVDEFLDFIRRSRDLIDSSTPGIKSTLRYLSLWEIRATIALSHDEKATSLIESHVRNFGHDAITYHLRGISELNSDDTSPEVLQFAAEQFKQAISSQGTWESRYARAIALLRAGETEQVIDLIRTMERDLRSPRERFWIDMLTAERYLATEQDSLAVNILRKWTIEQPTYALPRQLIVDGLNKIGNKSAADAHNRELDELRERFPGGLTPDLLASPLGVLAYERRPLK